MPATLHSTYPTLPSTYRKIFTAILADHIARVAATRQIVGHVLERSKIDVLLYLHSSCLALSFANPRDTRKCFGKEHCWTEYEKLGTCQAKATTPIDKIPLDTLLNPRCMEFDTSLLRSRMTQVRR